MVNNTPPKANMSYRRDDVLEAMVAILSNVDVGSEYNYKYRFITRDPMGTENIGKLAGGEVCVGVYDTAEEKHRLLGATNAILTVVVEFYYVPKFGESKSQALNILLAEITKALMLDQTVSGTAIMIEDTSNHLDIDGIYDKIVNGSITFHVTYRHGTFDPTKALF